MTVALDFDTACAVAWRLHNHDPVRKIEAMIEGIIKGMAGEGED